MFLNKSNQNGGNLSRYHTLCDILLYYLIVSITVSHWFYSNDLITHLLTFVFFTERLISGKKNPVLLYGS